MRNGWTKERRARQAEAIKRWRPWEKSTGPRTPGGKANAAANGTKSGPGARRLLRELRKVLREQREALREVERSDFSLPVTREGVSGT